MTAVRSVRRISDGVKFDAVRYGKEDGTWDKDCIIRVAAFLLEMHPDAMTNYHILEVVKPVLKDFDPSHGKASIEVLDKFSGRITVLELGEWIIKHPMASFVFVKSWAFDNEFEDVPQKIHDQEEEMIDDLGLYIYVNCFGPLDGQIYQALAETTARKLVKAGWRQLEVP